MSPSTTIITYILSSDIVILDIFVVFSFVFFVALFFDKKGRAEFFSTKKATFFRSWAEPLAFVIASAALLSSLYYSEIAGFVACKLCWYQRLFFYPQVPILLVPFFSKNKKSGEYAYLAVVALSMIGAAIAAFHYYGQVVNTSVLPCAATAGQSLCALIPFQTFGYITIPMMSLTGFLAVLALMGWYRLSHHVRS